MPRQLRDQNGLTLIELLAFIVIGAFIIPASIIAFTSVMQYFLKPDYHVKARFYAQQKIEEFTNKPFEDVAIRDMAVEPYPVIGTTGYRLTWEIHNIDPSTNPIQDGPNPNYKRISVYVVAPDSSLYRVHTIITKRLK
jgi:hypothetical protein